VLDLLFLPEERWQMVQQRDVKHAAKILKLVTPSESDD
jgi:hypothetical protein